MLRRIRNTQIGVIAGIVLVLILFQLKNAVGERVVVLFMFLWLVLANLAYRRLNCVHCGKWLPTTVGYFFRYRAMGLHTCAHCGQKQPP